MSASAKGPLSRRQWLRGAGGAALLLPVLPSLLEPRGAKAQGITPYKRFLQFGCHHGGVWEESMFPVDSMLTEQMAYADRQVKRGKLTLTTKNGKAWLSSVLNAPSSVLTPALASKMNVLRGVDYTMNLSHHGAGFMGNYAQNAGQCDGLAAVQMPLPTIDQMMGWSPEFYPDVTAIRQRVMVLGQYLSFNYTNPQARTGEIVEQSNASVQYSSDAFFEQVFGDLTAPPEEKRPSIVNRVLEDYRRLKNGNRRLSSNDKRRLEDHMQRLDELERRLTAVIDCGSPVKPPDSRSVEGANYDVDPDQQAAHWACYLDTVAAAFACGASRIACIKIEQMFTPYAGDWHDGVAHGTQEPELNELMFSTNQRFFEKVFFPFAQKLDAIDDGDGKTVLDNTLMTWSPEHGNRVHGVVCVPVITAGGAAGYFSTGNYIDYRNPAIELPTVYAEDLPYHYGGLHRQAGLPWGQWLGSVMQAMDVPREQWPSVPGVSNGGGYGPNFIGPEQAAGNWYPASIQQRMNQVLPYLKA